MPSLGFQRKKAGTRWGSRPFGLANVQTVSPASGNGCPGSWDGCTDAGEGKKRRKGGVGETSSVASSDDALVRCHMQAANPRPLPSISFTRIFWEGILRSGVHTPRTPFNLSRLGFAAAVNRFKRVGGVM